MRFRSVRLTAQRVGSVLVIGAFMLMNAATSKPKGSSSASSSGGSKSSTTMGGGGGFSWHVAPPRSANLQTWYTVYGRPDFPGMLIAQNATAMINMPRDVPITGMECGQINAWYSPQKHNISFCYDLADFFQKALLARKTQEAATRATLDAVTFVQLHEMGHALIAELDLGVAGGEEEAADDFASVIYAKRDPQVLIDGASAMLELGRLSSKPHYFDEHPVGEQRFYNILCLVYGADPAKWKALVNNPLPASRAARCQDEYHKKTKFWDDSLKPYRRQ